MSVNGSQVGSRSGRSMASSVGSSRAGSVRTKANSAISAKAKKLASKAQWFHALVTLEYPVNHKLTILGFLIEILQFLGFFLSGAYGSTPGTPSGGAWPSLLVNPIGTILFTLSLPFFDPTYAGFSEIAAVIIFWVAVALVILMAGCVIGQVQSDSNQTRETVMISAQKSVLHGMTSFGLVPLTNVLMSTMMCQLPGTTGEQPQGQQWLGNYALCEDHLTRGMRAASAISLCVLLSLAVLTSQFLHEDTATTLTIVGRATSSSVTFYRLFQMAFVISYHIYHQQQRIYVHGMFVAFVAMCVCLHFCWKLPYFTLLTTQVRTMTLSVVVAVGVMSSVATQVDNWPNLSHTVTTLLLVVGIIVGLLLGYVLPLFRVNGECIDQIKNIQSGVLVKDTPVQYPKNLPKRDLIFSQYKTLESDLMPAEAQRMDVSMNNTTTSTVIQALPSVLLPYVKTSHNPSDIELATRTELAFEDILTVPPPTRLKAYVSRIWTKGMLKYMKNSEVLLGFTYFLLSVHRNTMALNEVEKITSAANGGLLSGMNLWMDYRAYKVQINLRVFLNMADVSQTRLMSRTHGLHKDLLVQFSKLWDCLALYEGDIRRLSNLSDIILEKRTAAEEQFTQLMARPTRQSLLRFARFIDEILMQPEDAKKITDLVAEEHEKREMASKNRAEREQGQSGSGGDGQKSALSTSGSKMSSTATALSSMRSNLSVSGLASLSGTSLMLLLSMFCLVGLAVAIIGTNIGYTVELEQQLDELWAAGQSRTAISVGGYLVGEISAVQFNLSQGLMTDGEAQINLDLIRPKLAATAQILESYHSELMIGTLVSTYAPLRVFQEGARLEYLVDLPGSSGAAHSRFVDSLHNMGFRIAAAFARIADTSSTNFSTSVRNDITFIELNHLAAFGSAWNRSSEYYSEAVRQERVSQLTPLAILLLLLVALMVGVHAFMSLHTKHVTSRHLVTLTLFQQIPRKHIEKMREESKNKVDLFDAEGADVDVNFNDQSAMMDRLAAEQELEQQQKAQEGESKLTLENVADLMDDSRRGSTAGSTAGSSAGSRRSSTGSVAGVGGDGRGERQVTMRSNNQGRDPASPARTAGGATSRQGSVASAGAPKGSDAHGSDGEDEYSDDDVNAEEETNALTSNTNKKGSNGVVDACRRLPWMTITTLAMTVLIFALIVAGVVLSLGLEPRIWELNNLRTTSDQKMILANEIYSTILASSRHVRGFALQNVPDRVVEYHKQVNSVRMVEAYRELVLLETDSDNINTLATMQGIIDSLLERHEASMYLAALGYGYTSSQMEEIHLEKVQYNYTSLSDSARIFFTGFPEHSTPRPYVSDSLTDETNRTQTEQLHMARTLVYDQLYQAHYVLLERYRSQLNKNLEATIEHLRGEKVTLINVIIILFAVSLGACIIFFALRPVRQSASLPAISLTALLLIALLVLLGTFTSNSELLAKEDYAIANLHEAQNYSSSTLYNRNALVEAFLQFGDKTFYEKFELIATQSWADTLTLFLDASMFITDEHARAEFLDLVIDVRKHGDLVLLTGDVSMKQTLWAYQQDLLLSKSSVADLTYARSRERHAEKSFLQYGSGADMYTNSSYDRDNRTEAELVSIARMSIGGPAAADQAARLDESVKAMGSSVETQIQNARSELLASESVFSGVIPGLAGIGTLIFFGGGLVLIIETLTASAGAATHEARGKAGDSFSMQLVFALLFAFSWLAVALAFSASSIIDSSALMHQVEYALEREWLVVRSMGYAGELRKLTINHQVAESLTSRNFLLRHFSAIESARVALFSSTVSAAAHTTAHDELLFGPRGNLKQRFNYDCASPPAPRTLSSTTVPEYAFLTRTMSPLLSELMRDGVDAAAVSWMMQLQSLGNSENMAYNLTLGIISELGQEVEPLVYSLLDSSNRYHLEAKGTVATTSAIVVILSCIGVLAIIAVFGLFVVPKMQELTKYEQGTRLLIDMIPAAVRQDVPAISHYVETGEILEDARMATINKAVGEMTAVALLIIDDFGTVSLMSKAAQEEFGYTEIEVKGKNIKMLMPQEYAKNHDGYLARYKATGIKTVIDIARRVEGRRKDGSVFPVELMIREFKKTATESVYLGYVKNITVELESQAATMLTNVVSDLSMTPVFVINPRGKILRCNRASCSTFGYSRKEMENHNVKMLMPETLAVQHDGILKRYRRTRVKSVIDKDREGVGRRKNGTTFPVMLTIKEILNSSGTKAECFVGYVKDLTSSLETVQSAAANKAALDISPIPVISITGRGIVTQFSAAAEKSWGYKRSEVIDQNVKMLMTPDDARPHDSYLSRYLKTREAHVIGTKRIASGQRKDGSTFEIELNIQEVQREDGTTDFVAYIQDFSIKAEARARVSNFAAASQNAPFACILADQVGNILLFNSMAEKMFGFSPDETLGQNVTMLMPTATAKVHDVFLSDFRKKPAAAKQGAPKIVEGRKKNGQLIRLSLHVREAVVEDLTAPDGKRYTLIGYITPYEDKIAALRLADTTLERVGTLSPMIAISTTGTITAFSAATEKLIGYRVDEVLGRNVKMLMTDGDAKNHDKYLKRYEATGVKRILDQERLVAVRRSDGSTFTGQLRVREVKTHGRPTVFVANIIDVTQDIEDENAQSMADTAVMSSPVPVICINGIGTIRRFSPAACKSFGYEAKDVIDKNIKMLMPPQIAKEHDGFLRRYMKTGVKHVVDAIRVVQGVRKDGMLISVELSIREVASDLCGGTTAPEDRRFVAFARDLSQEYVLKQSIQLKDSILRDNPLSVFMIDVKGTIVLANPAASRVFGYTNDELMGSNIKMVQPRHIAEVHDGILSRYLETGIKNVIDTTREVPGRHKDGTEIPLEITVREIMVDGVPHYVGSLRPLADEIDLKRRKTIGVAYIEKSPDAIVIADFHGKIVDINPSGEELLGYSKSQCVGKEVDMFTPATVKRLEDTIFYNYADGALKVLESARQIPIKHQSGKTFNASVTLKGIARVENDLTIAYVTSLAGEQQLVSVEKMAAACNNLMTDGLIIMDDHGWILETNAATSRMFGYTAAEMKGQNIKLLQPPEIAEKHDGYLSTYRETKIKHVIDSSRDVTGKRKDGFLFPGRITVREIIMDGTTSFVGFFQDLTGERIIQEGNNLSGELIDNMQQCFLSIDILGEIMDVNDITVRTFGYPRKSDIVGQNIKMLMPKETADNHDFYLSRYRKDRVKRVVDTVRSVVAQHRDGTHFAVEILVKEGYFEETRNTRYNGFLKVMTDQHALQRQLTVTDKLGTMGSNGMITMDTYGEVKNMSSGAERVFGYTAAEVVGKNIKMLMPNHVAVHHDGYLTKFRGKSEAEVAAVVAAKRVVTAQGKDGRHFMVELMIMPTQGDDQEEVHLVAVLRTCTEEIELQRETTVYKELAKNACVAVVTADLMGLIVSVNQAALDLFRYKTQSMLVGKNVSALCPRAVGSSHDSYLALYRKTGKKTHFDTERFGLMGRQMNGDEIPISLLLKEILLPNNEKMLCAFINDGRVKMGELNTGSSITAVTALTTTPFLLLCSGGTANASERLRIHNADGSDQAPAEVVESNEEAELLLGFTKAEMLGCPARQIFQEAGVAAILKAVPRRTTRHRAADAPDQPPVVLKLKATRKDGSKFNGTVTVQRLDRTETETETMGASVSDPVTDRRQDLTHSVAQFDDEDEEFYVVLLDSDDNDNEIPARRPSRLPNTG